MNLSLKIRILRKLKLDHDNIVWVNTKMDGCMALKLAEASFNKYHEFKYNMCCSCLENDKYRVTVCN